MEKVQIAHWQTPLVEKPVQRKKHFNCEKCAYIVKSKQELDNHVEDTHNVNDSTLEINYYYCDFTTEKKDILKYHHDIY